MMKNMEMPTRLLYKGPVSSWFESIALYRILLKMSEGRFCVKHVLDWWNNVIGVQLKEEENTSRLSHLLRPALKCGDGEES